MSETEIFDLPEDSGKKEPPLAEKQPEPKTLWQHPFYKGFMYTAGAASVIFLTSIATTGLKLIWEDFEVFSILRPVSTSTPRVIPLDSSPVNIPSDSTFVNIPSDSTSVNIPSDSTSVP